MGLVSFAVSRTETEIKRSAYQIISTWNFKTSHVSNRGWGWSLGGWTGYHYPGTDSVSLSSKLFSSQPSLFQVGLWWRRIDT